jgi:phenylalanyl-tRNA synthetase beta chain
MTNKGFNEVINYSFLDRQVLENLSIENKSISIKNPLNNSLSALRTSLLPSLATNLEFNINRGQNFLSIFEMGKSFSKDTHMEELNLAGLIYDDEKFKNWNTNQNYDFYYLKGILENLFADFRIEKIFWKKSQNDLLHPYASADIYLKNKLIGSVGSINPRFIKSLGLNKAFLYFEIKIESLPRNDLRKLIAPSIYPISQRDFSFEIDNKVSYKQIENCIHISSKNFLIGTKIFDVYDGKNISDGKKSIAFRVSWGSNKKTLSEEEINKEANLIVSGMQKKFGATLR